MVTDRQLGGIVVDIEIKQGRGLCFKDRKLSKLGRLSSSDPFVKLYGGKTFLGKTKVIPDTVDPVWNERFQFQLGVDDANYILERNGSVKMEFRIFDHDRDKAHDPMGMVRIPINCREPPSTKWYEVGPGKGRFKCPDAKGHLEIFMAVSTRKMLSLERGDNHVLEYNAIKVCSSWDTGNDENVDLDTSCVAIDGGGRILMNDTVYYGNQANSNLSIIHSGDQQGDKAVDDDEVIICHLDIMPARIKALYFLLTVATPGGTFMNVQSAKVQVLELERSIGICQFIPSSFGANTAMFLFRIARSGDGKWILSVIEDFDSRSRCFGALIPEIKSYTSDLIPDIVVDPKERIAILRKGARIRISDFTRGKIPKWVAFGLKWDVTDGVNIDLDLSAICLAQDLRPLDIVFFKQLRSKDKSIRHSGDEREGDQTGDDERMLVSLPNTSPDIHYIGFVINSFSGQELDDVAMASCRLYDPKTNDNIATYTLSNASSLDKHTALLMGCLFRETAEQWNFRVISLPANGRTAHENVVDLQLYLFENPPLPRQLRPKNSKIIACHMPAPVELSRQESIRPATQSKRKSKKIV